VRTREGRSDPFYRTALWLRTRAAHLAREPLCRACKALGRVTPGREVDHVIPIAQGGDRTAQDNLQSLCSPHHRDKTAREQGKIIRMGCDENGIPLARQIN
jgi:5-methylcytosine-specific restriction enzyme A